MNRCFSVASAAALLAFTLSAAPNPVSAPARNAENVLKQVDFSAATIAHAADQMQAFAKSDSDPSINLSRLFTLKDDVNRIGADLRALDAERASLPDWQVAALDKVLPLMADVAANTEQEFHFYDADRNHLWATAYPQDADKIYSEASEVHNILDAYLKLASVQATEKSLEGQVNGSGVAR